MMDRGKSKRVRFFNAKDIADLGFGNSEMTRKRDDNTITEEVTRAFTLNCGCMVEASSECGGICYGCRAELEKELNQIEMFNENTLTPRHLDWMATPCGEHYQRCEAEFCGRGGCAKHIALAPNDKHYCFEHFKEFVKQMDHEEFAAQKGAAKASVRKVFKSFFEDD